MDQELNLHLIVTAKRLYNKAQGRAAHPGLINRPTFKNPNGVLQNDIVKPRWGLGVGTASLPRVRCATLGFVVQPLRGNDQMVG
jgi:hypothetical protein